jgi:hypothetical protein
MRRDKALDLSGCNSQRRRQGRKESCEEERVASTVPPAAASPSIWPGSGS